MLLGTNQDQGQRYNRRVIFDLVRLHGSISRTELTRYAGLSYQSVSNMADSLIEDGLLTEKRNRTGRRGQPPVDLSVNPDGGFSLGFSFNERTLRGALVDLVGAPRAESESELRSSSPSAVLPAIAAVAEQLIAEGHAPADRLYGLGLGMPGVSREGRFVSPASQSSHGWLREWSDVSIVETLQNELGIAVFTDNDAAASAIGELLYGEGRHHSDFMYLFISDGIGSGLVLNRRPFRGAHGVAGEIGHLTVKAGGLPCPCGRSGCLEGYASLLSARRHVGRPGASPLALAALLEEGDPGMVDWVDSAGCMLRQVIVSIENFLDPSVVFLGGTLPQSILDALYDAIMPLPPLIARKGESASARLLKVKVGLGPATLGAAALPMFEETASDVALLLKGPRIRRSA